MRILYIDIDSLRPDHLGCYGYARPTSPNIDRVAGRGICFDNCYASDVPCMPSRTSLFSGQFGIHHGCVSHTGTRADPLSEGVNRKFRSAWGHNNWMRQLRNAGMRTVTFSSFAERHAAWHWYAGFEEIHDTGYFGHEICDHVVPKALEWVRRNAEEDNWFLHVNLWDVHVPYRTPSEFGLRFTETPLPDPWLTEEMLQEHCRQPGMRSASNGRRIRNHSDKRPDLNPEKLATLKDVKLIHDAYDTAVLYVDQHVGRLIEALDTAGILNDTAIIVSADHGECLGELNAYGGHCFADHNVARVPLIISWPGITDERAGTREAGLHYHLDLAPTVCELLGIHPPDSWDARSFANILKHDQTPFNVREYLVVSQLAQACQRAVRFQHDDSGYLYIRTYHGGSYELPEQMLFNVSLDPHEDRDLATSLPDLVEVADQKLKDWKQAMLRNAILSDPLQTVLDDLLFREGGNRDRSGPPHASTLKDVNM